MSLQEKFQISVPYSEKKDADGNEWVDQSKVRCVENLQHANNRRSSDEVGGKFNYAPPGMELSNQTRININEQKLVMAGETDVSADVNPEAFAKGYTRRDMDGCDDQYTGEHMDLFYGEAVDEKGNAGFVERNNYLDRI